MGILALVRSLMYVEMTLVCFWAMQHNQTRYFANTLRPRQNGRHFADDLFKCIFLNENAWISLAFSLKFVPKVQINNNPSFVQIMAWRRSGDRPLSEPMMISLLTHICVTRPQWVNSEGKSNMIQQPIFGNIALSYGQRFVNDQLLSDYKTLYITVKMGLGSLSRAKIAERPTRVKLQNGVLNTP